MKPHLKKLVSLCVCLLPSLGFANIQVAITNVSADNQVLLGFNSSSGNARCSDYKIPNEDMLLSANGGTTQCSFTHTNGVTQVRIFVYSLSKNCQLLCTFEVNSYSPKVVQGKEHCAVKGSQLLLIGQ